MLWVLIRIASPKTYVVGTHYNCLGEAILMTIHNVSFYGEITKVTPILSSNTLLICSTIVSFTIFQVLASRNQHSIAFSIQIHNYTK